MRMLLLVTALSLTSCGLLGGGSAAKTALEIVAPIAAEALSKLIADRYGSEVDEDSAGCFALPELSDDESGFEYVICRAQPLK